MTPHDRDPITGWRDQAACSTNPHPFYAPDGPGETPPERHDREQAAVAICTACPVRATCAEAGLGEEHGIWGGLTEAQRATVNGRAPTHRTTHLITLSREDETAWRRQLTFPQLNAYAEAAKLGRNDAETVMALRELEARLRRAGRIQWREQLTDQDCRHWHSRWEGGDRSQNATEGHREWAKRNKQRRRATAA